MKNIHKAIKTFEIKTTSSLDLFEMISIEYIFHKSILYFTKTFPTKIGNLSRLKYLTDRFMTLQGQKENIDG